MTGLSAFGSIRFSFSVVLCSVVDFPVNAELLVGFCKQRGKQLNLSREFRNTLPESSIRLHEGLILSLRFATVVVRELRLLLSAGVYPPLNAVDQCTHLGVCAVLLGN